ncbi:glutathione S-transferase N-terminal domain-containing protein [Azospirillum sp. SYSU D00513]|uniref:glutathione S-transferase family protein n=1 Tax=Azospirillum sp. SYSU D00513 TaxID=2812561 RepID=UPI001A957E43|nr:glutathione S-transferase N-terminal domain-containing protein [Azospirillum sp. SYSU D00513]
MITLYSWASPNGHKVSILLEELGLSYKVRKIDVLAGEHRQPDYLAVSPIGKIPALIEDLPGGRKRRLFGSGPILIHFAERTRRLLPETAEAKGEAMNWLMLGISDLAPAAANLFRFGVRAPEKIPYAIDYFKSELARCYDAMEARLAGSEYLAEDYSIADIACFPFVAASAAADMEMFERYPNLKRWHDVIAERPAVKRGMAVPE